MTIESTLYSILSGDVGVSALVGNRIYPNIAPQNAAVPYVSYQLISASAFNLTKGAPTAERKIFQLNCISNSYLQAKDIAEAIKAALNVDAAYLRGEGDDYFIDTQRHRVRLDFAFIG